jgi:hypothetical protein
MRASLKIRSLVALASTGLLSLAALPAHAAGTWTKAPTNSASGGNAFGLWMLTDGTVLSHGNGLQNWVILTPDKKGSYATGTWKSVAGKAHGRGGAQQHVLKDGRFLEIGGEYVDGPFCTPALCASGEIFDPIKNTWTSITPAPFAVGDTGSATLSDGRILESQQTGNQIAIYDPSTDKWTAEGTSPLSIGQENAWAELQNGGILAVGYAGAGAAIYNPATGKFTKTGPVPSGFNTGDTGGISLTFDGRVFVYGLNSKSYIYTPGATAADAGTWAAGPTLLAAEAEDEFSNTMPDGRVFGSLVSVTYGPGVTLQAFDPGTNTVASIPPPPDGGNPYPIGYVNLPNGQVMATASNNNWIYTSDIQPQDAWRPTVSSVTFKSGTSYTISGTQLSGLINGSDEGDDMTNQQNYPIVWLTDSAGNVYYCRTSNFSNMMPSKGSAVETADFTTPAGLPSGSYNLFVSAVGVQSKTAFPFTPGTSTTGGGTGGAGGTSSGGASNGGASSAGASNGGASSAGATSSAGTTSSGGVSSAGATSSGGSAGLSSGAGAGGTGTTAGGGTTTTGASGASSSGGTVGHAGSSSSGASSSGSPGNGASGAASGGADEKSGCSCSAVGVAGRGNAAGALLCLAGVLAVAKRRRRRIV